MTARRWWAYLTWPASSVVPHQQPWVLEAMLPPLLLQTAAPADDLAQYIPIIAMLLIGGGIAAGLVVFVSIIGRRKVSLVKGTPFEAGSVPVHGAWRRVHVRYYVVALLFIVFDLEAVFLVIWAPLLQELGLYGLVVMGLFVLLLAIGLAYEWGKGALNWHENESREVSSRS